DQTIQPKPGSRERNRHPVGAIDGNQTSPDPGNYPSRRQNSGLVAKLASGIQTANFDQSELASSLVRCGHFACLAAMVEHCYQQCERPIAFLPAQPMNLLVARPSAPLLLLLQG